MKSKNRRRLESNQQQIQEHIISVMNEGENPTQVGNLDLREFSVDGLSELADKYEILRDSHLGIRRFEKTLADGSLSIVRDARSRNAESDELDEYSTAMLGPKSCFC